MYGLGAQLNNLNATLNHINTTVTNLNNTLNTLNTTVTNQHNTLITRVAASEYNGCVRAHNSQMRGADVSIARVKSPADVLPQLGGQDRPPTTIRALHRMSAAECQPLLTFYGLPSPANLQHKRQQLCFHLGVQAPQ